MSNLPTPYTENLHHYVLEHSLRETQILRKLRDRTSELKEHNMQIAPEQGQFMALLVKLIGAKKIVEVGTFTGYSALCMALALKQGGKIFCCDISEEWTTIAKVYWEKAKVLDKIDLRIAPAIDTLNALLAEHKDDIDLIFLDADKENYQRYYELGLKLLRKGGIILIDNVFWDGDVVDSSKSDPEVDAIRALNQALKNDTRIDLSILPIADGLTLAHKR